MAKRKFAKTPIAQKALLTSSASRRFHAIDDPEGGYEFQIRQDVGSGPPEDVDDLAVRERSEIGGKAPGETPQDRRDIAESAEKAEQVRLSVNVPPEAQGEVIRRYRERKRQKELTRREAEVAALEAERASGYRRDPGKDSPTDFSNYVYPPEESQIKSKLTGLHNVVNKQATMSYLGRGGATRVTQGIRGGELSFEGGPVYYQPAPTLQDQLTETSSDREMASGHRSDRALTEAEEDPFVRGPDVVMNREDLARRQELLEKRQQLKRLELDIKSKQQRRRGDVVGPGEHENVSVEGSRYLGTRERRQVISRFIGQPNITPDQTRRVLGAAKVKTKGKPDQELLIKPSEEQLSLPEVGRFTPSTQRRIEKEREEAAGPKKQSESQREDSRRARRQKELDIEKEKKRAARYGIPYVKPEPKPESLFGPKELPIGGGKTAKMRPRIVQKVKSTDYELREPTDIERATTHRPLPFGEQPPSLQKLKEQTQAEREQIEKELRSLKPDAIVSGVRVSPEDTRKVARSALKNALTVPDPLQQDPLGYSHGNMPVAITKGDQTAYLDAVVESHHGATEAIRVHAARRAERLAYQISQQVLHKHQRRQETAEMNKVKSEVTGRHRVWTGASGWQVRGSERTYADLHAATKGLAEININKPPPPRPPGSLPSKGSPEWRYTLGDIPIADPRLNDRTVEDLYSTSKHEKIAPRLQWEKEKLQKKLVGEVPDEVFLRSKPAPFESIARQGTFMHKQARARLKGFLDGTEIIGLDEQGKVSRLSGKGSRTMIGTAPRMRIGTSPNIMYQYKVRNPQQDSEEAVSAQVSIDRLEENRQELAERIKAQQTPNPRDQRQLSQLDRRIERQRGQLDKFIQPTERELFPTDQRTRFAQGVRNRFGALSPDESDELVAPVETRVQQTSPFVYRYGTRQLKEGRLEKPEGIDEVRLVPVPGGKGETHTITDPDRPTKTIYVMHTAGWAGRPGLRETQLTHEEYEDALKQRQRWESERSGDPPPLVQEKTVDRKIQLRYMDPSKLEMVGSQRDVATLKLPKIGPLNERLAILQFNDDTAQLWNKYVGQPVEKHAQTQKLLAAKSAFTTMHPSPEVDEELKKHGIKDRREARLLLSAATTAGFYTQRERFLHGRGPQMANKIKFGQKMGLGEYMFPVHESLVRPKLEKTAQIPFMLRHPLTSPTGKGIGIDVNRWRNRQELINPQVFAARAIREQERDLARIGRTAEFTKKYKDRRGPIGAYTRFKLEGLSKSPDYQFNPQEFRSETSRLRKAATVSREARDEGIFTYWREKTGDQETIKLGPNATREAQRLAGRYQRVKQQVHDPNLFAPPKLGPTFTQRAILGPGSERNIMLGAAAAGTVIGAAYLYHRHQQNKLPDDEKVSFYNKVLPPPFRGPPIPKARVTQTVKFGNKPWLQEVGLSGKELPTQIGVGFERRKVALRPMDRGYAASAPVVGRPSFKGTPGGKRRKGLVFYGNEGFSGKRSNIKRSTHEIRVLGKKLPGAVNIGPLRDIKRQASNPNRMSSEEMDNLIWAHNNTPLEGQVKNFYRGQGGRVATELLDRWDDPDELQRIRRWKQRTSREQRGAERRALTQQQRPRSAIRR